MTLPLPGNSISAQQINIELGNANASKTPTSTLSLNAADARALANVPSGEIAYSDFYGKSSIQTAVTSISWSPPGPIAPGSSSTLNFSFNRSTTWMYSVPGGSPGSGMGGPATSGSVSVNFPSQGSYTATVTPTPSGTANSASITVSPPPPPPYFDGIVFLIGAGGGGGAGQSTGGGGGGGAGGYNLLQAHFEYDRGYSFLVGAGGAGGTANPASDGSDGGETYITGPGLETPTGGVYTSNYRVVYGGGGGGRGGRVGRNGENGGGGGAGAGPSSGGTGSTATSQSPYGGFAGGSTRAGLTGGAGGAGIGTAGINGTGQSVPGAPQSIDWVISAGSNVWPSYGPTYTTVDPALGYAAQGGAGNEPVPHYYLNPANQPDPSYPESRFVCVGGPGGGGPYDGSRDAPGRWQGYSYYNPSLPPNGQWETLWQQAWQPATQGSTTDRNARNNFGGGGGGGSGSISGPGVGEAGGRGADGMVRIWHRGGYLEFNNYSGGPGANIHRTKTGTLSPGVDTVISLLNPGYYNFTAREFEPPATVTNIYWSPSPVTVGETSNLVFTFSNSTTYGYTLSGPGISGGGGGSGSSGIEGPIYFPEAGTIYGNVTPTPGGTTASATLTVNPPPPPPSDFSINVLLIGGGGGGGMGKASESGQPAGGGGGGSCGCWGRTQGTIVGTAYINVQVGSGGAGSTSTAGNNKGGDGEPTTISSPGATFNTVTPQTLVFSGYIAEVEGGSGGGSWATGGIALDGQSYGGWGGSGAGGGSRGGLQGGSKYVQGPGGGPFGLGNSKWGDSSFGRGDNRGGGSANSPVPSTTGSGGGGGSGGNAPIPNPASTDGTSSSGGTGGGGYNLVTGLPQYIPTMAIDPSYPDGTYIAAGGGGGGRTTATNGPGGTGWQPATQGSTTDLNARPGYGHGGRGGGPGQAGGKGSDGSARIASGRQLNVIQTPPGGEVFERRDQYGSWLYILIGPGIYVLQST